LLASKQASAKHNLVLGCSAQWTNPDVRLEDLIGQIYRGGLRDLFEPADRVPERWQVGDSSIVHWWAGMWIFGKECRSQLLNFAMMGPTPTVNVLPKP
jgi:hypothetical protein